MSVLIKGMEMPKDYPIRITLYPNGQVVKADALDYEEFESVIVPPHGDLIDRDALLASENQHYEIHSDSFYVETRTIELAPTIIEEEGKT